MPLSFYVLSLLLLVNLVVRSLENPVNHTIIFSGESVMRFGPSVSVLDCSHDKDLCTSQWWIGPTKKPLDIYLLSHYTAGPNTSWSLAFTQSAIITVIGYRDPGVHRESVVKLNDEVDDLIHADSENSNQTALYERGDLLPHVTYIIQINYSGSGVLSIPGVYLSAGAQALELPPPSSSTPLPERTNTPTQVVAPTSIASHARPESLLASSRSISSMTSPSTGAVASVDSITDDSPSRSSLQSSRSLSMSLTSSEHRPAPSSSQEKAGDSENNTKTIIIATLAGILALFCSFSLLWRWRSRHQRSVQLAHSLLPSTTADGGDPVRNEKIRRIRGSAHQLSTVDEPAEEMFPRPAPESPLYDNTEGYLPLDVELPPSYVTESSDGHENCTTTTRGPCSPTDNSPDPRVV
ncbi:hypothetical protein EXIGLDRAFT_835380 [Exidia glandulosa HHB12029]|uniref:Uncharacterized protein n=1 Tax=Exidia glandulosa HHB12029 TaxID=1314781 RepID=A0A165ITV7_EXIGL|nr:hypothetical protein EXIGLDRAFT_835380 [Exidia glandulosa HHB12029]